jgi:hypothetical protein
MSQENVEIIRRLYPGTVDLVATVGGPEGFETTRVALEPLVLPTSRPSLFRGKYR